MRAHHEHWISLSDLMASVVAVMVLLFVMSTVRGALATAKATEETIAAEDRARQAHDDAERARARVLARQSQEGAELNVLFDELRRESVGGELEGIVDLVPAERRIRLQDTTFGSGDACLRPAARSVLARWSARHLRPFLERHPGVSLAVEGHADSAALGVDLNSFVARNGHTSNPRCALFDDNITLSAARAREARRAMLDAGGATWPAVLAARVNVAGYGSSRPRQGLPTHDPRNRRVEILVLSDERPELGATPSANRAAP